MTFNMDVQYNTLTVTEGFIHIAYSYITVFWSDLTLWLNIADLYHFQDNMLKPRVYVTMKI